MQGSHSCDTNLNRASISNHLMFHLDTPQAALGQIL